MTAPALNARSGPGIPPVLSVGLRPFFLLAALSAPAFVAVWLLNLAGCLTLDGTAAPVSWHAHEMLFGFVGAAVGGFMLTAVPNWTGCRPVSGWPLGGLAALWVAGRVASLPSVSDAPLAAVIDLAFFPAVGAAVALPLIRAGKARNAAFLVLLLLLTLANLLFRMDWLDLAPGAAAQGIVLSVGVVLMMTTVIGGRIVPAFTRNALRTRAHDVDLGAPKPLELATLGLTLAMIPVDLAMPGSSASGAVAAAAALTHAGRLAFWGGARTLRMPILWILHLGYLWIPLALALKATALLGGSVAGAAWMHALTAGGFGTMILAVMSRAALGHTGRALVTPPATVAAYGVLTLSVLARVAAPALPGELYPAALAAAGGLWALTFLLFLWDYVPILVQPRADGRTD
ncbi:NnrS family protein [Arenibaculum pallidiluteum]|uniref:NnrS family protein n=1 Tax=Arenibaculum pallidiluteum TaxID=2812559 RepID=UPI001A976BDE|nr:NnrS family protein [Arenibaculum pallidiluteum]